MADPIRPTDSSSVGYYDAEAGECRLDEVSHLSCSASRDSSAPTAAAPTARSASEPDMGVGGQAAVDELVSAQTRKSASTQARADDDNCLAAIAGALATCTNATATILSMSPTGAMGILTAASAGELCGERAVQVYDRCLEP